MRLVWLPLACVSEMVEAYGVSPEDPVASPASPPREKGVEFDENMLRLRGIDPKLADYFREAPRFTTGRHTVSLHVNGRPLGQVSARFDRDGELCADTTLLQSAGIDPPSTRETSAEPACVDLMAHWPQASIEVDSSAASVALLVPTDALRRPTEDAPEFSGGGTAALLNYEIVALDSRWGSRSSRYASANTELGVNAGDWVVRSRQVSTMTDGRRRTEVLDTYAQRTFARHRAVLQVGEINLVNPVLSGAQMVGAQILSEQALATQRSGAAVEGIAQSQARVEVRQGGVLVYTTVVPAGPFSLSDIPRINRYADLDVTVIGSGGDAQHFVVSAAMASDTMSSSGFSFGAGRARNTGSGEAPWLMSGGWTRPLRRGVLLSGGVLGASRYRAAGLGVVASTRFGSQLQFNLSAAQAPRDASSGLQALLTLSQRLDDQWSFAVSHSRQGRGYRELADTTFTTNIESRRTRTRDQSSASLSWSRADFGSLSAGYTHTMLFDGRRTSRAMASWGTRVGRASVSVSAEWSLGNPDRERGTDRNGNSIYLNLSVPLGENRRLGTSVRRYGGETRYGANFSDQINEYASYRTSLEYRSSDRRGSVSAGMSFLPKYFQLDTGYTRNPESDSYSLGLRGGLVVHNHGLTASPYAVRDTFGVVSVGDTPNVRVSTPGGPVWTDARGYAVIPQLSAFGKSRIAVDTGSLPRNVDIENGAAVIEVGRGAVTTLAFAVSTTRRVLLSATTVEGRRLPVGATVTDESGDLVSLVQGDGQIFVPNALQASRLWVSGPEVPRCELVYELPSETNRAAYYETAAAVCRAVGGLAP